MLSKHRGPGTEAQVIRKWACAVLVALCASVLGITVTAGDAFAATRSTVATPAAPPSLVQPSLRYGPEPQQLLELLLPRPADFPGPRPVIVYLHAGGWVAGDRTAVDATAAAEVARGYAVASVEYRLAGKDPAGQPIPSFPGAIRDVERAIAFLQAHAGDWNLNPRHFVLMGASAGGYLATFVGATGTRFRSSGVHPATERTAAAVVGIVDLVGPTDLVTFERTHHAWASPLTSSFLGCPLPTAADPLPCPPALLQEASVAPYVDASDPPIFMAYGQLDTLVVPATQELPLARAWIDGHHGDPDAATYQIVSGAGHNLTPAEIETSLDQWLARLHDGRPAVAVTARTTSRNGTTVRSSVTGRG